MVTDSLDGLKSAFDTWRRTRRNIREHIPETLVTRARRAAQEHGASAVVEATSVSLPMRDDFAVVDFYYFDRVLARLGLGASC